MPAVWPGTADGPNLKSSASGRNFGKVIEGAVLAVALAVALTVHLGTPAAVPVGFAVSSTS